jgi:hypothetical protein
MKNLTGSMIYKMPEVDAAPNDEVRYVKTEYGTTKEVLTSEKCAVCQERLWEEDKGISSWLQEAFCVMDPRAYVGGLPDYIKISHCLKKCHFTCKDELNKRLSAGEYL